MIIWNIKGAIVIAIVIFNTLKSYTRIFFIETRGELKVSGTFFEC